MKNLKTFESFSMPDRKVFYAAMDHYFSFPSFVELEVDKLKNYGHNEVEAWKEKYGLTDDSKLIWVTDDSNLGPKYENLPAEYSKINVPQRGLAETYFDGDDGMIIPESTDEGGYFLFVLK
jgi:hypothetical protein